MPEILTAGETMAVLVPEGTGPLHYHDRYQLKVAGAESNVAIGVCKLGHTASFLSRIGEDEMGIFILHTLRAEGVEVNRVKTDSGYHTGLMLKEMDERGTKVFYYRENSAASHMQAEDVQEKVLEGVKIVHLTGVTPVLSKSCEETVDKLFALAHQKNIPVSFDPNIRKKLWGDKDYSELIRNYTMQAQIVLMGLDEAEILLETRDKDKIFHRLFVEGNARVAAIKDGANGAFVSDGKSIEEIPPYPCHPKETIGAGDGFNAGFLCGVLEEKPLHICGKMGAVCGALATEVTGDFEGYPTQVQMKQILNGEQEIFR